MQSPSASYSLTVRLEITNRPGMLGQVTSAIGKAGGDIGAIDLVQVGKSTITATSRSRRATSRTASRSSRRSAMFAA